MEKIKDNKNSNRIKEIFKIIEKQTQVRNNASWKLKKQVGEIIAKNKEIMQRHHEYAQKIQDLLHEIWDDVDPLDQN